MASAAQLDVEDNSVAAVVCTLVVCSIDDDQTRKTLQEVKRVLKPVSNTLVYFTVEPLCRCSSLQRGGRFKCGGVGAAIFM